MNSGAYASYPKRTRYSGNRNYRFKKFLGRKRAIRVNPVNQYTYRKTRIGRLTKTNMQVLKATFVDTIALNSGTGPNYVFGSTNVAYRNLSAILLASPEFVSRQSQYSYYMITGMAVSYTRMWIDPIAYGVDGVSPGFLAAFYTDGLSMLSTNFYPNLVNAVVGQPVEDADSSWKVSPFIHGVQSHYQPFPKNFTTGTNSNGLGVWNACTQVVNLQGEVAIYNSGGALVSNAGEFSIFDVEINVYCVFCNNTGA